MNDALGHNMPPADLLVGDALLERLRADHLGLLDRFSELDEALAGVPNRIEDDPTANDVADLLKMVLAANHHADAARKKDKQPYWDGGKTIDGFFSKMQTPLEKAANAVRVRLTVYLREKADRERREREAREQEARELERLRREEADRAAREAQTQIDLEDAIRKEQEAKDAEADRISATKLAEASNAELSRVRGQYGSLGSLRTTWIFSGLDRETIDLEALRTFLPLSGLESAVNAFIKAGGRELRGVKIHETTSAVVR